MHFQNNTTHEQSFTVHYNDYIAAAKRNEKRHKRVPEELIKQCETNLQAFKLESGKSPSNGKHSYLKVESLET